MAKYKIVYVIGAFYEQLQTVFFFGVNVLQIFCNRLSVYFEISLLDIAAFLVEIQPLFFLETTFQSDFDAYFEICKPSFRFTGCQLECRIVCVLDCLPACMISCCDLKTAEIEYQIIDRTAMKRNRVTTKLKQKSITLNFQQLSIFFRYCILIGKNVRLEILIAESLFTLYLP